MEREPSHNQLDQGTNDAPRECDASLAYWRANLRWLLGLLSAWFLVSHVAGIWLADWLDQFRFWGGGMKLGFWFAQQGSIYAFIVIIGIYVVVMNRLDRKLLGGVDEADAKVSDH